MPFEAGVNGKPSSGNLSGLSFFDWFDQDTTTVIVIDDQYILVASGGDVGITACEVGVCFAVKLVDECIAFL